MIFLIIITLVITLPLGSHARNGIGQDNVSPSPSPWQFCNGAESTSCQLKGITTCFIYSSQTNPHEDICLLVQNNGEIPLHVKVMVLPANNTVKEIDLPSHQMKKINISLDVNLSSGIALNTSNGDCVIHVAAPPPQHHQQKYSSYGTYINPSNCAYLVIILLIIGGILTFFKLRIRARHLKGVPYHELEM